MKIIIMYDISTENDNLPFSNKFRNSLIKMGYHRMQYSIYVKTIGFQTVYNYEKERLMKIIPPKSNVRVLLVTEKQYANIDILMGEKSINEYYNDKERYIEL
ncbi:CRISPR-associated endonuclease Cas2 [Mycoplasma enhydrae]|nr:CRISPR-associated endonuclease Cas2 [Mycoplasma enhydrae]MCV3753584.1 CRISPR-associated endonuclease Cas2 [Mycoplasma enhydrae]